MKSDLYCNPVPLPDLPLGMGRVFPDRLSAGYIAQNCDYREVADPEILPYEGKYYAYMSCRQVYVSEDLIHWDYQPLEIDFPLGYAPCVTCCGKNIYITSSIRYGEKYARIYAAEHPTGPFKTLGIPKDKNGKPIEDFLDPALFTDDDNRVYLYWGYAPLGGGIFGMEVDPQHPDCGISDIVKLFDLESKNPWEHFGRHGEVTDFGWNEGASMYKYNGVYYLQYAACGTRFPNYAIGVYMLDSPLGPVKKPATLLCCNPHGVVSGTGHGGMFTGPDGKPWQTYSVLVHRLHYFERRIGIDPVSFDENGVPKVEVSDSPRSVSAGKVDLVNAAAWKNSAVSSYQPHTPGFYALDECLHTAWFPQVEDKQPHFTVDLEREFTIHALRLIWAEDNADVRNNIQYGPVNYRVNFLDNNGNVLDFTIDKSSNQRDLAVEFLQIAPITARYVQLTILRGSNPMVYGLSDLAVFTEPRTMGNQ